MAPEQHTDAKNVDRRADIYALGMTLYEMLSGRLPWGEDLDLMGMLMCKQNGDIPPPTKFYQWIPPGVVAALMSTLLPDRRDRPASVGALREVLEVLDGARSPPAADPLTVVETPEKVAGPTPSPAPQRLTPTVKPAPTAVESVAPKPGMSNKWMVMAVAAVVLLAAIYLVQSREEAQPVTTETTPPLAKQEEPPRKKAAEIKAAEIKAAEKRLAEKKAAEMKAAEMKAAEKKAAEKKAAEKKAAEKKAAEIKAEEKRLAEKKAAEIIKKWNKCWYWCCKKRWGASAWRIGRIYTTNKDGVIVPDMWCRVPAVGNSYWSTPNWIQSKTKACEKACKARADPWFVP